MRISPMKFQGEVIFEEGRKKLKLKNESYFLHHLKKFNGKVILTIEELKKTRSLKSNRRYWGGVINQAMQDASELTGYTADELHEHFKQLYGQKKIVTVNGKETVMFFTRYMTDGEFTEYCMNVERDLAGLGIRIMTVDEYYNGVTEML